MITKKKVKIDKEFGNHILSILRSWIVGEHRDFATNDIVDSMHKLKEIFGIEYKDTVLRRGILSYQEFENPQKNIISMTSNFKLQPWTDNEFDSSFFIHSRSYDYIVEANIPAENILLSYDDRNLIIQKLSKKLNKTPMSNHYHYEREWMIYLPTKKIKLTDLYTVKK